MSGGARWAALAVTIVVAILHVATAGQYDAFRNELYFLVCGRHPAFGYVDQPPLVPLLIAITQIGGVNVWLMRLPATLTAIAVVPMTVSFAQLLGASTRGAWLAAVAAGFATMLAAMSATFSTSTLEILTYTGVAYFIVRAFVKEEPQMLLWAGVLGGISFEIRYGILMWGASLAIGLLLCGPRAVLRKRELWFGIGLAAILALPNVIWQAAHGFPFLELVRNDNSGNFLGTPVEFVLQQIFLMNVLLAPLWIAGIVLPFVLARLRPYRFLAVTFVAMAALILITHGKAYYFAAAYPTIFALGAAACTQLPRLLVGIWAVLSVANGALALPFVLPLLPVGRFKVMLDHSRFKPKPMERAGIGAPLMQVYSDEFGWRDLAGIVQRTYEALPADERAKTAIFAPNYGEASAVDVYGRGLPPAISGNNQYYLWGTRGFDGSVVLAINVDPARWAQFCDSAKVVAYTEDSPYAMPYEVHRPIVLCRGMHPPLPQLWPQFKHYGIENLGQDER